MSYLDDDVELPVIPLAQVLRRAAKQDLRAALNERDGLTQKQERQECQAGPVCRRLGRPAGC